MPLVCSKYTPHIDLSKFSKDTGIERIFSSRIKNYNEEYYLVASNKTHFLQNNKVTPLNQINITKGKILVLTNKEANYLLEYSINNNVSILIFENLFPFFKDIKYVSMEENYKQLLKKIEFLKKQNIPIKKISTVYSDLFLHKVERKIRNKSKLDRAFRLYPLSGYQEVFKIKEARSDRSILCFDFNSMYPSLLDESFFDPKYFNYKKVEKYVKSVNEIENGLHHVVLNKCNNEFFKKFNYFKYMDLNIKESFIIEDDLIEVLLFSDELKFIYQYFDEVFIIDSIISKRSITHPLHKDAQRLFSQRISFRKDGNSTLEAMTKYKLTLLHSCTNQKKFKKITIKEKNSLPRIIADNFDIPSDKSALFIEELIKKGSLRIKSHHDNFEIYCLDNSSPFNILALSSHVISKAKVKLMKILMDFLQFNDLEVCYINIDCLHISIKSQDIDAFLDKFSHVIGDNMGELKLEHIADKGYWLSVGRYWLYKNKNLLTHKNIIFNTRQSKT